MIKNTAPIFLTLLSLLMAFRPVSGKPELSEIKGKLYDLSSKISQVQFVAQKNGHSEVDELGQNAQASLSEAKAAWRTITTRYSSKPWLASESSSKTTVQEHIDAVGGTIQSLWAHEHVKSDSDSYSACLQDLQSTYERLQTTTHSIWKRSPPSPSSSGTYSRQQALARRELEQLKLGNCPLGETACPISSTSQGFECINTHQELSSCGGCVTLNQGENCLQIEGAAGVGCLAGKCLVLSAQPGYYLSQNGRPVPRRKKA